MPSNGSEAELQATLEFLKSIADYRVFPLLLETALVAFLTVLVVYFLYARLSRGTWSSVLVVSLCLYALAVACWGLDIRLLWQALCVDLPRLLSLPDSDPGLDMGLDQGPIPFAQEVLWVCVYSLGDGVTIWRAYVISGKPPWLRVTILGIFVVEAVIYALVIAAEVGGLAQGPHSGLQSRSIYLSLSTAACSFTAAGQVFASSLIGYKAWRHWKEVKDFMDNSGARGSQRSISLMLLIVETGIAYTLLWIWFALSRSDTTSELGLKAWYWSSYYMVPTAAIYPTLVVVLVTARCSVLDRSLTEPYKPSALEFATTFPAAESRSDVDGASQIVRDERSVKSLERAELSETECSEKTLVIVHSRAQSGQL
ncbi:hypothetical protein PENSPDRAFT_70944 [Peniophora sp. CONT]|nr:hypothetical protein PENSPDRAFT_70944 [Peniophora sp. CONT]